LKLDFSAGNLIFGPLPVTVPRNRRWLVLAASGPPASNISITKGAVTIVLDSKTAVADFPSLRYPLPLTDGWTLNGSAFLAWEWDA